jgi:NAD(P)-dependent dehydrogenase (short-subunit alcohol dehydrogenase family)
MSNYRQAAGGIQAIACGPPRSTTCSMQNADGPRVAVVTGAAGGIGRALVAELVQRGYHVEALVRRRQRQPVGLCESRDILSPAVHYSTADLANPAHVDGVAESLARAHERVHLLINNAAVCPTGWTPREFSEAWLVNVNAPARLLSALTPALMRAAARAVTGSTASDLCAPPPLQPPPVVLKISSGDAELLFFGTQLRAQLEHAATGGDDDRDLDCDRTATLASAVTELGRAMHDVGRDTPSHLRDGIIHGPEPAYRLSKACLNAFTRRAAADLAPLGVRVIAACPGDVPTRMMSATTTVSAASTIACTVAATANTVAATANTAATTTNPAATTANTAATAATTATATSAVAKPATPVVTQADRAARELIDLVECLDTAPGTFYRHGRPIPW